MARATPSVHARARPELPRLVHVPGGGFTMGAHDIAEAEAPNPPHSVSLSPFWIGVAPVTNAEYRVFMKEHGAREPATWQEARFGGSLQPVVDVSWDDAAAFCAWAGGHLPSEAQWELAARGLTGRRYPWGEEAPDEHRAHFAQDWNRGGPCDVGTHAAGAGPFGCEDLAGNVWEWCADGWRLDAHVERVRQGSRDPVVPTAGSDVRPLRGGCWRSIDPKLQGAYRNWSHRVVRHVTIGFRLCVGEGA
jgi:formylglycine-generating enzyme required for sulfatase activity